jgi:ABC-type transport system involved in cytochrome c biogenesis permease subunit
LFKTNDTVDTLTVVISVFLMIWIVPHVLLTFLITPVLLLRPSWIAAELGIQSFESTFVVESAPQKDGKTPPAKKPRSELGGIFHGEKQRGQHDTRGKAWLKQSRNAILDRKMFIAVTAAVVFIVALIAMLNRAEFNPDIRPIAAVLRSNFWLTVHVIAIIVSYAAAFIAWGLATVSLGFVVFGRYRRSEPGWEGQRTQILLPEPCQMFSPVIEVLVKIALLLLIVGTVLGARWADYSWGRFWSWDPKEVWALITIIFFVIVLHGKAARYYGAIGITVGALFASIAVIITWYGINFVFKGSVHAYGGGAESNAALFLGAFIAVNLLWGTLALLRYNTELYGNEAADS